MNRVDYIFFFKKINEDGSVEWIRKSGPNSCAEFISIIWGYDEAIMWAKSRKFSAVVEVLEKHPEWKNIKAENPHNIQGDTGEFRKKLFEDVPPRTKCNYLSEGLLKESAGIAGIYFSCEKDPDFFKSQQRDDPQWAFSTCMGFDPDCQKCPHHTSTSYVIV